MPPERWWALAQLHVTSPDVALGTAGKRTIKKNKCKELITAPVQVGHQGELITTLQVGHQRLPLSSLSLVKTRVIVLTFDCLTW